MAAPSGRIPRVQNQMTVPMVPRKLRFMWDAKCFVRSVFPAMSDQAASAATAKTDRQRRSSQAPKSAAPDLAKAAVSAVKKAAASIQRLCIDVLSKQKKRL